MSRAGSAGPRWCPVRAPAPGHKSLPRPLPWESGSHLRTGRPRPCGPLGSLGEPRGGGSCRQGSPLHQDAEHGRVAVNPAASSRANTCGISRTAMRVTGQSRQSSRGGMGTGPRSPSTPLEVSRPRCCPAFPQGPQAPGSPGSLSLERSRLGPTVADSGQQLPGTQPRVPLRVACVWSVAAVV